MTTVMRVVSMVLVTSASPTVYLIIPAGEIIIQIKTALRSPDVNYDSYAYFVNVGGGVVSLNGRVYGDPCGRRIFQRKMQKKSALRICYPEITNVCGL